MPQRAFRPKDYLRAGSADLEGNIGLFVKAGLAKVFTKAANGAQELRANGHVSAFHVVHKRRGHPVA
jgi:hypothetical protein